MVICKFISAQKNAHRRHEWLSVRGYRDTVFQTGYNDTLYDFPLMITTRIPDLLILICSRDEVVVEVAILRPWRSMILYWLSAAAIFNEARNKETTRTSTKASKDYYSILKSRYTALSGVVTAALNGGVAAEKKAALSIKDKFVRITSVFATRTDAIAKLETVIVGFRTLPASHLSKPSATLPRLYATPKCA